jgi:multidrug efflux pump subunit AcrA (membrane-fusion protein)
VTVALERTDPERMRPGMSVKVAVTARRIEDAILAPRDALDLGTDEPHAVLAGGARVPVVLGPCDALRCVIEAGLEAGQPLRAKGPR